MTDKRFHISDILSVSTGRKLTPAGMNSIRGIHELTKHITGNDAIIDGNEELASQFIKETMPWTQVINTSEIAEGASQQSIDKFMQEVEKKHGSHHNVGQMPKQPDASSLGSVENLDRIINSQNEGPQL